MATPAVLDVEALLVPIAGDNPSGRNLFYEPQYDELREARRVEDDTPRATGSARPSWPTGIASSSSARTSSRA
jgi:hypothetical protein